MFSISAVLAKVSAPTQLRLRRLLREACRDLDAVFAGVWLVDRAYTGERLEYGGDPRLGPAKIPIAESEVASFTTIVDASADTHGAVICGGRLGRFYPSLSVVVVDPGSPNARLLEAVEELVWAIEEVVVGQ